MVEKVCRETKIASQKLWLWKQRRNSHQRCNNYKFDRSENSKRTSSGDHEAQKTFKNGN